MIEEIGRIVAIRDGRIWVEVERGAGCKKCEAGEGCGQGLFAKLSRRRISHFELTCDEALEIGDQVVISVAEDVLVKSSLLSFGLPLLTMIGAAVIADWLLNLAEPMVIGGGILGLFAGMLGARLFSKRLVGNSSYHPRFVRAIPRDAVGHFPA